MVLEAVTISLLMCVICWNCFKLQLFTRKQRQFNSDLSGRNSSNDSQTKLFRIALIIPTLVILAFICQTIHEILLLSYHGDETLVSILFQVLYMVFVGCAAMLILYFYIFRLEISFQSSIYELSNQTKRLLYCGYTALIVTVIMVLIFANLEKNNDIKILLYFISILANSTVFLFVILSIMIIFFKTLLKLVVAQKRDSLTRTSQNVNTASPTITTVATEDGTITNVNGMPPAASTNISKTADNTKINNYKDLNEHQTFLVEAIGKQSLLYSVFVVLLFSMIIVYFLTLLTPKFGFRILLMYQIIIVNVFIDLIFLSFAACDKYYVKCCFKLDLYMKNCCTRIALKHMNQE